jgi:hypothetical protein
MKVFHIIGTSHEEKGGTTVEDLITEISIVKPDVIFEEVPMNMFEEIYEKHAHFDSFEVKAIRKYTENNHNVKHFPIDINKLPEVCNMLEIMKIGEAVEDYIKKQDERCRAKIISERLEKMDEFGIKKINSHLHRRLEIEKQINVNAYLRKNNRELYFKNKLENNFHFQIRENFMMNEILNKINEYKNPLLIIGYSHIPTIAKKIKMYIKGIKVSYINA